MSPKPSKPAINHREIIFSEFMRPDSVGCSWFSDPTLAIEIAPCSRLAVLLTPLSRSSGDTIHEGTPLAGCHMLLSLVTYGPIARACLATSSASCADARALSAAYVAF